MNIKEILKHMWFGTRVVTTAIVALLVGILLAAYVPWLLLTLGLLWLVWFVGYMLS